MIKTIGLIAAVILPLWNIPFIYRVIKRKSSSDVSLSWALGVWGCVLAMLPAALISPDFIWKAFNIINVVLFTGVVAAVLRYRRR